MHLYMCVWKLHLIFLSESEKHQKYALVFPQVKWTGFKMGKMPYITETNSGFKPHPHPTRISMLYSTSSLLCKYNTQWCQKSCTNTLTETFSLIKMITEVVLMIKCCDNLKYSLHLPLHFGSAIFFFVSLPTVSALEVVEGVPFQWRNNRILQAICFQQRANKSFLLALHHISQSSKWYVKNLKTFVWHRAI